MHDPHPIETATAPVIIELAGVTFRYPGSAVNALDALDFHFHEKDRIGIVAPNGSGKTTLFHVIMGLLTPDTGRIHIFGHPRTEEKDFHEVRRRIGLLFQDADDQLFSPTVIEDVAFGPLNLGKTPQEARVIALETLDQLELGGFADRITFKLSGGEKRMVALATILAMKPEVLLLDEPTAGLDSDTKAHLISVLNRLDLPSIVISHEFDFIDSVSRSIYTMEKGKIRMDRQVHIHHHAHAHAHGQQPHKHHGEVGS